LSLEGLGRTMTVISIRSFGSIVPIAFMVGSFAFSLPVTALRFFDDVIVNSLLKTRLVRGVVWLIGVFCAVAVARGQAPAPRDIEDPHQVSTLNVPLPSRCYGLPER